MKPNRERSGATWNRIDELAWKIRNRAVATKDNETAKDADFIIALLRSLAVDVTMEDRNAEENRPDAGEASTQV